ncbi:hypothetical protein GW17_00011942 [Ensete ventricosum]|nr:hypothetical protein GW17_00011942 [Ensete ventricosum]
MCDSSQLSHTINEAASNLLSGFLPFLAPTYPSISIFLNIGHHPEQANWSVNQIQAEAIPQDLIRKQSVVTKPHLDILQIHAPLEQPPQDGLPRIDHLEEMLCDGRVHGPSRPPSDSDLYLVTELAVGILQEGSKDATPRPSASAGDPQPVAI